MNVVLFLTRVNFFMNVVLFLTRGELLYECSYISYEGRTSV